jgi:hypothetical protein
MVWRTINFMFSKIQPKKHNMYLHVRFWHLDHAREHWRSCLENIEYQLTFQWSVSACSSYLLLYAPLLRTLWMGSQILRATVNENRGITHVWEGFNYTIIRRFSTDRCWFIVYWTLIWSLSVCFSYLLCVSQPLCTAQWVGKDELRSSDGLQNKILR